MNIQISTLDFIDKMKEGYYITEDGEKKTILSFDQYPNNYDCEDFYMNNSLFGFFLIFRNRNIVEINLPSGYYGLFCYDGMVNKINTCDDIKELHCMSNNIKNLIIKPNMIRVRANNNPIEHIETTEIELNYNLNIILSMDTQINPFDYPDISFEFY